MSMRRTLCKTGLIAIAFLIALASDQSFAQTTPANSVVGFPGAGALTAGDLWESLLPSAFGPFYGEAGDAPTRGNRQFIRFGNFDRAWTTPNSHWPAAFPWTMYWSHYMHVMDFNPDTTWNPANIGGVANPSFYSGSAGPTGTYSNYSMLAYKSTLNGASDAARKYSVEPYWVDGTRRQHAVYEAAFPTNLGLDVKIRAHGFQGPNWNNLNDYVIVEIEFKNTGFLDMNMDGTAERTNNDIRALALNMAGEIFMSISSQPGGGRNVNSISNKFTRMGGWIGDADPNGEPWAFNAYYSGASLQVPTAGNFDMGFNAPTIKNYTDTWNGWVWLDIKSGGLPVDRSQSTASLPTKNNIFGTHPIGTGTKRGDYVSAGSGGALAASTTNPLRMHTVSVGTFYQNGGSSRNASDFNLTPNSNFFLTGTPGDITTFVANPVGTRPSGDQKYTNIFEQTPLEDGTGYTTGWGKWTTGYNFAHDFNGDLFSGVGPVSIAKDSTITVVMALVGGYRLEGIQKSVRAARWAYANNFALPTLPNLPAMKVSNTLSKTVEIQWDNAAESDPQFAGYKIWKSSNFLKKSWLTEGLRLADRFQEQMVVGAAKDTLKKPVNPKFDAFGAVNSSAQTGLYQPDTWGTWELLKTVSAGQLGTLQTGTLPYSYRLEDPDVVLGFSYWYYISAYKEGTYTGPGGETTTRIETHYTNRNGTDGLWHRTFPFATVNANYNAATLGGVHIVSSALAPSGEVSNVGVRPNPYKRAALHDNFSNVYDHKLLFYNLPPECTITILDVAGQIIDQIKFQSTNPNNGSIFWDMFSKDGIEVASGLYIYVVESPSGSQKMGHFAILR